MVQVSIGGGGEFERAEADIVQSLIINTVGLVCVLDQLMDGQSGIVGLNHSVGHLHYRNISIQSRDTSLENMPLEFTIAKSHNTK